MATLYIIGNGFDLHHHLKTAYSDFHRYLSDHKGDLELELEQYFTFNTNEAYLWSSFETDLGSFNWESLYDNYNHTDIGSDSFKMSDAYGLTDELVQAGEELAESIRETFKEWIEDLDYPDLDDQDQKLIRLDGQSKFVNFNYTGSLELYYNISRADILYIHNKADDFGSDLVFGHCCIQGHKPKQEELDASGDSNRTIFTDAENAARSIFFEFQKDTASILKSHEGFFKNLSGIDQVVVLGHSLGEVDWPYFKHIRKCLPSAFWKISHYSSPEKTYHLKVAKEILSLDKQHYRLIHIQELLS